MGVLAIILLVCFALSLGYVLGSGHERQRLKFNELEAALKRIRSSAERGNYHTRLPKGFPFPEVSGAINILMEKLEERRVDVLEAQAELSERDYDIELARGSLESQLRELERATQYKSQFLANMSHEIRTPLNAIINYSDFALESKVEEERMEFLLSLKECGAHLLHLVNDILDISKIEAGELCLERRSFDLHAEILSAIRYLEPLSKKKEVRIFEIVDPEIPKFVLGDSVRLRQILVNLVSNAIKFCSHFGSVLIWASLRDVDGDQAQIRLAVCDTGIGMSSKVKATVFEVFKQADSSMTRKFGGTGLGLSIVKQLVELMDGTVRVESREGVGSQFLIEIPFVIDRREEAERSQEELETGIQKLVEAVKDNKALNILVAEDQLINQKVIKHILSKAGHNVSVASDGLAAVDQYVQSEGGFDLILMDIQMPEMDGEEATSFIRRYQQDLGRHVPIIALTAHAIEGDKERYLAGGMDGYVSKPVDRKKLFSEIRRCLDESGEQLRSEEP